MKLVFTELLLTMCSSAVKMRCCWMYLLCWLLFSGTATGAWDMYAEETQDLHSDLNDPVFQVYGRQKKDMQNEILSLLGLHHRPRPRAQGTENSAPKFMIDLYKTISTENNETSEEIPSYVLLHDLRHNYTLKEVDELNHADVVMSFPLHHKKHHKSGRINVQRCDFDVSDVSLEDIVTSAELRIYKRAIESDTVHRISVYQVLSGSPEKETILLESRKVLGSQQGWLVFDVTHAEGVWDMIEKDELKIHVQVESLQGHAVDIDDVGLLGEGVTEDKQPFVVAFFKTSEEAQSRRRRGAGSKKKHRNRDRDRNKNKDAASQFENDADYNRRSDRSCQKRSLYVSFRELGWQDWIIAPEGYSAFYCNGECSFPLNAHMNATNHAIVQTLVHLIDPDVVPKPCCAPTKLSAISVLYFDDSSNVILKKYRNMVVRSCGCH